MDKAGSELKKDANEVKGKLEDAGNQIEKEAKEVKDKVTGDK